MLPIDQSGALCEKYENVISGLKTNFTNNNKFAFIFQCYCAWMGIQATLLYLSASCYVLPSSARINRTIKINPIKPLGQ